MKHAALFPLAWFVFTAPAVRAADRPSPREVAFFEKQVRPVLAEHCFRCHGPDKQKADLRLDSRAALLQGGESGAAVVPGNPNRSILIRAVRHDGAVKMPPKKKLPDQVVAALAAWVKMGVPWPAETKAAPKSSPRGGAEPWKKHWAFQPVRKPALPAVRDGRWPLSPVDHFVLAKLEAGGMTPSRPADRRTLIRRATFDLVGLPPTPEEVAAFEADQAPDAFARLIDRLLASPRYGERWGRHWLDVARYADTKGYVFLEERRFPYSYTYRDWVIRAFNEDLPYDRFVVQQLAADRLPLGEDRRPLAALGFLTVGRRFLNNPHDIIDDRIDVVSRGLLGLTVTCARCHDHKFDPVPMRDYYSLYGVFASSVEPPELPLIGTPEQTPAYQAFERELHAREAKLNAFVAQHTGDLLKRFRAQAVDYLLAVYAQQHRFTAEQPAPVRAADFNPRLVRRWQAYLDRARSRHDPVLAPWLAFAALGPKDFPAKAPALAAKFAANADPMRRINPLVAKALAGKPPASIRQVAQVYAGLLATADRKWQQAVELASIQKGSAAPQALADPAQEALRQVLYGPGSPVNLPRRELIRFVDRKVRDEATNLRRRVEQWKATAPAAPPRAMVLNDLPQPVAPRVLLRGNPNNPGPVVPRQFLAVLSGPDRQPFRHGSGRLEMARAIADPRNPLTARVMVNRLWLHHFGAGLVRTPSDFGLRSDPPTHPELLDYLAARFVEEGWSVKALHRLIMLSRTYQQDSADNPDYALKDPENRLLWKVSRSRLDFEALRDSFLAVSGRLDLQVGGRPVELTTAPFSGRRTVYGFIDRQNLPGLFRTFDFASPDATNPQRFTTTVPQQALFLLNSPFVVEQARALVARPALTRLKTPQEQIQALYQRLYGRAAEPDEVALGLRFLEAASRPTADKAALPAAAPLTPWEKYAQVLLLANEFCFVD